MKRVRLAAVAGASAVLYTPVIVVFLLLSSPDALSADATDVPERVNDFETVPDCI